jgi:hypothetical protein
MADDKVEPMAQPLDLDLDLGTALVSPRRDQWNQTVLVSVVAPNS